MKQISLSVTLLAISAIAVSASEIWSYNDCVEYARTHNISLQKLRLSETTSQLDVEEAKAQWQPTLDFATSHSYANAPWGNGSKNAYNSSYGLNAGWTVWNGGQRENTIKRNRLQSEISKLSTENAVRTLETDLLQVYLNILYAKESIGIYEEAERLSAAQAERARLLMESGRISKVDYVQLQSQNEQDKYQLVNARGTYDSRRMELKKLLELGIDTELELAQVNWTDAEVIAALPEISESYRLALATDVRMRGLELEKEGSELDVSIAKAAGLPKISLNAGVGTAYSAPGNSFGSSLKQNWSESIGLTLSVPILDNKRTKTAVARAKVQQLDAQLDINQRQTDLAQLVENWYIDTRSAQARFTAAGEQLKSAELTADLTNEQLKLGLVNPVELMAAHNTLIEARHTLLQAKFMAMLGRKMIEFYRTANISLNN